MASVISANRRQATGGKAYLKNLYLLYTIFSQEGTGLNCFSGDVCCLLNMLIAFVNIADPDQTPHNIHCLLTEYSIKHRGLMLWLFVGPTGVYLLDFFCSGIQFNLLLSPYPCFISLLYLDLYVLGDDALISLGSFMQTKYLCVLIHI